MDGRPSRDRVSPQRRILVTSKIAARITGDRDVLVTSVRVTALSGIARMKPGNGIRYHHFLLDQHEIFISNAAYAEGLCPGEHALKTILAAGA